MILITLDLSRYINFFLKTNLFINGYTRSLTTSLHYYDTRPLVGTRGFRPSSPPLDQLKAVIVPILLIYSFVIVGSYPLLLLL